jgi:hypothetical protein
MGMNMKLGDELAEQTFEIFKGYIDRRIEEAKQEVQSAYVGPWEADREYRRGMIVTFGGNAWHCATTTSTKPGDGSPLWQCMLPGPKR